MNNKSKLLVTMMALVVLIVAGVSSCKKKFDAPPGPSDPAMTATHTIAQLKALHTVGGAFDVVSTDMIISGVVIANDKSGNLYKQIYIQDATGAIQVMLDATNLYNTYPVGRRVFIKVKGLCVSDYNGLMELGIKANVDGSPTIQGIPSGLIKQYLFGGSINNPVTVKVVTDINALGTGMQDPAIGNLIQLDNYEFNAGDTTKTYGDTSAYKADLNRTIKTCDGSNVIIRTSGYANFAGVKLPGGNGRLLAIYTVFRTTKQLVLRDTADVQLKGVRCSFFEEDFQTYTSTGTAALSMPGWKNIMETGDVPFTMATFGTNVFPKVSAFTSTKLSTTNISSWLISPGINIPAGTSPKFSFTCARRYPAGTFKVYISTDFDGTNPTTATWDLISTVPAGTATAFTPFDPFGPYNLGTYAGKKIYIGFRYQATAGTAASSVGTYEPDDIKITK